MLIIYHVPDVVWLLWTEYDRWFLSRAYILVPWDRQAVNHACNTDRPHVTALSFTELCRCHYFYKLNVCGNLVLSKSIRTIFPKNICSFPVSASHFSNSQNIPNFFIIIFAMVISDVVAKDYNLLKIQMMVSSFSNK